MMIAAILIDLAIIILFLRNIQLILTDIRDKL
jgi:hypothetical protein